MTVDRDPREGDEFQWVGGVGKCVVDAVTPRGDLVYYTTDSLGPYVTTVDYWREYAILVAPHPKVADCWGWLSHAGEFHLSPSEAAARTTIGGNVVCVARIVGGRVCDEHGEPFEAAT